MQLKTGFNNTLFYPHPITESNQTYQGTTFYRLAAPSAVNAPYFIIGIGNEGYIGKFTLDNKRGTFRPLVRLKSSTTLVSGTDGYDYNLIDNSI